jgi:hypothetical protein
VEDSGQYVVLNFLLLIAGIGVVGYVLHVVFFRHESPERRMAGFAVVFIGAVVGMILVNKAVF